MRQLLHDVGSLRLNVLFFIKRHGFRYIVNYHSPLTPIIFMENRLMFTLYTSLFSPINVNTTAPGPV